MNSVEYDTESMLMESERSERATDIIWSNVTSEGADFEISFDAKDYWGRIEFVGNRYEIVRSTKMPSSAINEVEEAFEALLQTGEYDNDTD